MNRALATFSLAMFLILLIYLPVANPPEYFVAQIQFEYALHAEFWGQDHAEHVLAQFINMYTLSPDASVFRRSTSELGARLADVPYFQSLRALLALMSYRALAFVASLPVLGMFILVMLADGVIRRAVKSKEFLQHKADLFAVYSSLAIATICASVVALVLPMTVPPIVLALAPILTGALASLAASHFHRHG